MILTNKQEEGLKIAVARYKSHEPYTCISGYAGTGKSTLIKFIINALEIDPDDVAYITFTGKAASVLRQKNCPNAMTAHKLLYYSKQMPSGKFIYHPRASLDKQYALIVVDEVSMLPKKLWDLLLSHRIHVIACGDPFQLPPVSKEESHDVLDHPHIFLDEIMRQAQESEIIRLTMDIRAGKPIKANRGSEVQIIDSLEFQGGMYFWADQIIVATNGKRNFINQMVRSIDGKGPEPVKGDKVICLQNSWDYLDDDLNGALVNGTIGFLGDIIKTTISPSIPLVPNNIKVLKTSITTDNNETFSSLPYIDYKSLTEGKKFLTPEQEYLFKRRKNLPYDPPVEFNYGYAITCHKAQGSQWDKVLVFEERFPYDKEEHARWLYTACTRAASRLILVRS